MEHDTIAFVAGLLTGIAILWVAIASSTPSDEPLAPE